MENEIKLLSISEILGKNFFIPSYQRGYRWTSQQVEDLLNDIYTFAKKQGKTEKEFYCLQPIITKKCNDEIIERYSLKSHMDNNVWYEVIDGQQRLTTLRILLFFLVKKHLNNSTLIEEYGKEEFFIEFETRIGISGFLQNIQPSKNNIDEYFISKSYNTIENWFENFEKKRAVRENILRTLVHSIDTQEQEGVVQIIWYEIRDNSNPIDTFLRINMGKIPLTNAELIKALFLQKRNFENNEIAELRQIEIANEWDNIEYSLQDDKFWFFLNKESNNNSSRIDFLFDLIYKVAKEEAVINNQIEAFNKKYGNDKYKTFRFFNNKLSVYDIQWPDIQKEWNNIKDYSLAFDEWFNDVVWYHYIGYLIHVGESIIKIYNLYKGSSKKEFTQKLKDTIKSRKKNSIGKIDCIKEKSSDDIDYTYKIELPYENKNKKTINELLLLLNIQFIVQQHIESNQELEKEIYIRFPFHLFKKEKWDIEHIDSYTSNTLEDKNSRNDWLKISIDDLGDSINDALREQIISFIKSKKNDTKEFEKLRQKVVKIAKEDDTNEELLNSIGNLTLLDNGTNRSYGNALFPSKRKLIIEKDMVGKFIPICTKNVFLKYFDKDGYTRNEWREEDNLNYQKFIVETLSDFLTCKNINHE